MILDNLSSAKTVAIAGHIRPDGDCMGSTLGLYHYLREIWPEKEISVYLEEVPDNLKLLPGWEVIQNTIPMNPVVDGFICLDCSDLKRLGFAAPLFQNAGMTLCIDHHVSNDNFADFNMVRPDASSTCEVLCSLVDFNRLPHDAAVCFYTGIVHDTGVFKHSNTSKATMETAGRLIEFGINTSEIIDRSFYSKTYIQNQILGRCLLESFLALQGKVIISVLAKEVTDFYHARTQDLDGIIDQLRVTEGVETALFVYELNPGEYKVSMRSNSIVDVAKIAVMFGGGGHIHAAGFEYTGDYHDILNNLLIQIDSQLEKMN